MKKQLTAAICGAYMGCEIAQWITENDGVSGKLVGIEQDKCFALLGDGKTQSWARYHTCQLILTPLAKITDEDAIEIYKIIYSPLYTGGLIVRKSGKDYAIEVYSKYSDGEQLSGKVNIYPETLEICYYEEGKLENPDTYRALLIWDYLRSRHYDCGYSDIPSLIAAGLAVEKTNI